MRPDRFSTAILAAFGLIAGYAVAVATFRSLGGLVLFAVGVVCAFQWLLYGGIRFACVLTGIYLLAFAVSHVLALAVGAWISVLIVAAGTAAAALWYPSRRDQVG
jgi:hypothetical protein